MNGFNLRWLLLVICLYLAAILNVCLAPRVAVFGAAPNFLLILIPIFGMRVTRLKGMFLGLVVGVIQGGLAGADIQHFVAGGVIGGFIAASCIDLGLEYSILSVAIVSSLVTFAAVMIHVLLSPPPHVSKAILDTLLEAIYNGVLALPIFALLGRMLRPDEKLSSL